MAGMQLSELRRDQRTCSYRTPLGKVVQIVYRPGALTPNVTARLRESATTEDVSLVSLVMTIIVSWDLQDGDEAVPITPEGLGDLPIWFLSGALASTYEDMRASTEGKASGGGSSPEGSLVAARNGTGSIS